MSQKVTMQTIAEKLNISKVTVHKALSGKTDISRELREKILQTSVELGYTQIDALAKQCRWFFFLIPKDFFTSVEQYYTNIYNKLSYMFDSLGIKVDLRLIDENFDAEKFIKQNEKFSQNYGIYIAGPANAKHLKKFEQENIPCVAIDYINDKLNLNYIFVDNYRAGYQLTNYLIQTGHKRLCAVIDINKSSSNLDKFLGFVKSLAKNGIQYSPEMLISSDLSKTTELANFILPEPMPDALIFDCDYSAYNFYIYALSQNIKIPQDISIASFDNTELCLDMTPQLTSMGPDISELIQQCHDLMLKNFLSGTNRKRIVTMYSKLHTRGSVNLAKNSD